MIRVMQNVMKRSQKNSNKHAKQIRQAIRFFMSKRGLSTDPWCKRAGFTEGALRQFLSGDTQSIGADKLLALAEAAGTTLSSMLEEGGFRERLTVGIMKNGKIFPLDNNSLVPHSSHPVVVKNNENSKKPT